MSLPLTGQLLVATPFLTDPNFARAVVYVLDHDEDGTLGVVVNRPTHVDVTAILPPWSELTSSPHVVFQGGPVALDSALGLAAINGAAADEDEAEEEPLGWRRVFGGIGLVDLDAPPEILAAELRSMRIFAGYAGWGPGQLEEEIAEGAWYVVEAEPADAFSNDPDDLWRRVLKRQTGELAFVATLPDDPSMN
jgi:putative transcriptional regulator